MNGDRPWVARYNPERQRPTSKTEWATPWYVFDAAVAVFDAAPRTLDAAASSINTKCERFFGLSDPNQIANDGMAQRWSGEHIWLNPPFGQAAKQYRVIDWVNKCIAEYTHRDSPALSIIALLPGTFEQEWFSVLIDSNPHIVLVQPRIQFTDTGSNPSNSILAYWGPLGMNADFRIRRRQINTVFLRKYYRK